MDLAQLLAAIQEIHQTRQSQQRLDAARALTVRPSEFVEERDRFQGLRVAPVTYIYPDYFSASSQWAKALAAVPTVDWVILNPSSGPGTAVNADYEEQGERARAAGALVLGYVATGYGTADPATVRSQVQQYRDWYQVDGIFLDEVVSGWQADDSLTVFYEDIYSWAQTNHPGLVIASNPGAASAPRIVAACDMLVSYENTAANYLTATDTDLQPAHYLDQPRAKFWHLVHTVTSQAQAQDVLVKARRLHVGHIYVTDGTVATNPWDSLPVDWLWDLQVKAAAYRAPNSNVGAQLVPATATSPGNPGDVAYDATYLYICVAANTWRRVGIASWV